MRRLIASLLSATMWTGVWGVTPAQAEPISTFFIGLGAGLTAGAGAIGAYLGTLGAGFAAGQFLAANAVMLALAAGSLLFQAFQNRTMETSQINFRQPNSVRRHAAGLEEVGGHVGFASWDNTGAFWYMIVHCDSELMETIAIKFDDVVIAKDGSNKVTTEEFIGEQNGWFGSVSRKPYYSHWLRTFSPSDPAPLMPAAFRSTFPEWTADHKMAGSTVSIVKIDPVADEANISSVYRWRGPIGLGEPAVSIIGVWNRIRDPRKPGHLPNAPATWEKSTNAALIAAWHRTRRQGFNMASEEVNWSLVADAADKCDVSITDRYGVAAPLYAGGGMWDESRENIAIESDIYAGCDGQTMFDEQGRWYPKVGFWEEPTLTLTADRDIFAMSDTEPRDGEAEMDGVVVEYKEQDLGYVMQPCAPWKNPNFYQAGKEPRYLSVKIPFCKNHRQAVTLAKALGRKAQATRRIAPQAGLRGRRAKRERIIALDYDASINGNWQVAAPVQLDSAGVSSLLMLVPAYPDNWTLLPGEEGEKPTGDSVELDDTIPNPSGVTIAAVAIPGSTGDVARLQVTFNQPTRVGDIVEVHYKQTSETVWQAMDTVMAELVAFSAVVANGATYNWQYRMRRGGRSTAFIAGTPITVALDPIAPGIPLSFDADVAGPVVELSWITPNSGNFRASRLWRAPSGTPFDSATDISGPIFSGATTTQSVTNNPGAGTWDYWVTAENASQVRSAPVGPETVTVI